MSTIEKQVLEKLESSLNSKSITYDKQEMKVKHFVFLNGFANEFTPQAIIADFISYYNDLLKGPQKDDAKIIDELKTWLNPKSTNKEK